MAQDEVVALSIRFDAARRNATSRGVQAEFELLLSEVASKSHVVVAMPLLCARQLLSDPRQIYAGYEKLVGSGTRTPASIQNDGDRRAVGGRLFGSFADEIRYGVLSLDGTSLPNYGLVFARLRNVAIEQRVSFLHENSYLFLDNEKTKMRDDLPRGYRSGWRNRGELAATKTEPMLFAGSGPLNWASQIVVRGASRSDDMCIEAHIFGGFDAKAVESISFAHSGTSRDERNDIASIEELMVKRSSAGGTT